LKGITYVATREGKAQGGPRDGIKLMCPLSWDGRVEQPRNVSGPIRYYAGWYGWDEDFQAWIWHSDKAAK
jgi:hypothetical protein